MTNLDNVLNSRDITLPTKVRLVKSIVFPVVMHGELDHKEGWVPKNRCFQIMVLEKTLQSPLDCKEIKPVNPKGNQHWIFNWTTDAEAEAPILWPLDSKRPLTGKEAVVGKDWRQKGATDNEMVGWHHRLNGHEFEQTLRDSEGQGSLVCCSPWGSQTAGHDLATEQQVVIRKALNCVQHKAKHCTILGYYYF